MLNYEYPPLGGGGGTATENILKVLSNIPDVSVDLVTSSGDGRERRERLGEDIRILRLPVGKRDIHYWTNREILTYTYRAAGQVRQLLREDSYDVVHAFFGIPCGAIAYLNRKSMPYIVSLRGSDVPGFNKRFSLMYPILKPIIKRVWENAAYVVTNSEGLRELAYETLPAISIDVIPNGVDAPSFKRGDEGHTPTILCVGRLIPRKGIRYLIEGIPLIREKLGGGFKVVVVGEGPCEAELKELSKKLGVADIVDFRGYVPREEIHGVYASSDVFVLPSLNEGMSNTLLEALASALPAVVTDTGGTRELVRENGFIVGKNSPEEIAEAVAILLKDPEKRKEMGKKSREIAKEYSWEKTAEEYMKLYRRAARAHPKLPS